MCNALLDRKEILKFFEFFFVKFLSKNCWETWYISGRKCFHLVCRRRKHRLLYLTVKPQPLVLL